MAKSKFISSLVLSLDITLLPWLAPSLDVIASCIEQAADDIGSLRAISLTSRAVRRLCYRYLFRRIHYSSGFERTYSLEDLNEGLNQIPHLCRHVREFDISPQRASYWGLFTATQLTPCTLRSLLTHFPRLTALTLRSFSFVRCSHAGSCVPCPPLDECCNVYLSRFMVDPSCNLVTFLEPCGCTRFLHNAYKLLT